VVAPEPLPDDEPPLPLPLLLVPLLLPLPLPLLLLLPPLPLLAPPPPSSDPGGVEFEPSSPASTVGLPIEGVATCPPQSVTACSPHAAIVPIKSERLSVVRPANPKIMVSQHLSVPHLTKGVSLVRETADKLMGCFRTATYTVVRREPCSSYAIEPARVPITMCARQRHHSELLAWGPPVPRCVHEQPNNVPKTGTHGSAT
jgi:hypothetical protein